MKVLSFCKSNDSITYVWIDHGFSRCFMELYPPLLLLLLISVLAFTIIRRYRRCKKIRKMWKYSRLSSTNSTIDAETANFPCCGDPKFKGFAFSNIPRPPLYIVQWLLHFILMLIPVSDVIGRFSLCAGCIHGGALYNGIISFFTWLAALICLQKERRMLYRMKAKCHSLPLLAFWALGFIIQACVLMSWNSKLWWFHQKDSLYTLELAEFCIKFSSSFLLFGLGLYGPGLYDAKADAKRRKKSLDEKKKPDKPKSPFADFLVKSKQLWPFLWPKDRWLQVRVVLCGILLGLGRVVNVFVPLQYKKIVNFLTGVTPSSVASTPWQVILPYIGMMFLQGSGSSSMGVLNNLRSFIWIKVRQYTSRSVQVQLFTHLHNLSLRWHLSRKTGEVIRMVDRGATSIDSLLSYILFNIFPTIADIIVAIIFFASAFNGWFALIVFVTMTMYLVVTIAVTEWRTKFRRDMNERDNATKAKAVDSLLNFETVKYYNNEAFEVHRYDEKIVDYQEYEWRSQGSLNVLNTLQNLVITCGLLTGTMYCGHLVLAGKLNVGDFVLFISYITQLYVPLNFFGTYYRMIQTAFIDMENMFDLLREEVEVVDKPDAVTLNLREGMIEFRDVTFSYDSRTILNGISFSVLPGQTVALVGPSGSGKSTIIRLLFRFYDLTSGRISIDGQDITQVSQTTLRQVIGVVPQDTVLFNDSVRYNIRYGRVHASEEEVDNAAEAADIRQKILTLKDGFETIVGERGLKLSGGEKQRVAIARTILKAPAIILLDEATSALDTQTERNIQNSLDQVSRNRTTIVVAHRLSTIVNADQILVLKDGNIVESGTHDVLLEKHGLYSDMWMQQLSGEQETDSESSTG